ncbi:sulfate ABC transporter permease subunit CysT [Mycolicibacterium elephantis]|uniref:Sulfate transport system permease protein CysT n=1 Tax=Mycolicibacterium elephantis DSM 44368 TaxID=1335622 RepID=A0A439E0T5_9MYCO|nr:sulfate ABC transporter permease subunit CysT [Mycolicibacterium elephantis]MCV7221593.1 sulfate ABC transporter permease subunit CysT [Mycolicibacterium elephantis]RWA24030.1 sulfate ABC transporter permease [Mycolicibacterium elephantis DSM 44368]
MTASLDPEATRQEPTGSGGAGSPRGFFTSRYGSTKLRVGVATTWLSVIVLLPLAAIAWQSTGGGLDAFWKAVTSNGAIQSFKVTLIVSVAVAVINLVFGLLVAWVMTRDDFPGKRLVDAIIDLPFALPTIVASLVMLALYGPSSPVGIHLQHTKWGVGMALLFVTLPFVVRSVQPVLLELDREVEEAAASLGADNFTIFRLVLLPALLPSLLSGAGLAFSRAIGEYGSVVLIGGAVPGETEVSSQYIRTLIEFDDRTGAAAVSIVLLAVSFIVLFILRSIGSRAAKRQELSE